MAAYFESPRCWWSSLETGPLQCVGPGARQERVRRPRMCTPTGDRGTEQRMQSGSQPGQEVKSSIRPIEYSRTTQARWLGRLHNRQLGLEAVDHDFSKYIYGHRFCFRPRRLISGFPARFTAPLRLAVCRTSDRALFPNRPGATSRQIRSIGCGREELGSHQHVRARVPT